MVNAWKCHSHSSAPHGDNVSLPFGLFEKMGLDKLSLEFDNPSLTYYSVQNVSGRVFFKCNEQVSTEG